MKKLILSAFLILSFLISQKANAQYTCLHNFTGSVDGAGPAGDLLFDGTFLYGMTPYGGSNGLGVIFKIKPDGSSFTGLLNFDGLINGSSPFGSLISDGTFLYGMTSYGGLNDKGTIFKIMPDGTGYVKLLDFDGSANGQQPYGSLFYDGTFFYGMTLSGGVNGMGNLFKIMPDGSGYVNLLDFAGAMNGNSPHGSLISDGTYLYGTTSFGGTSSNCPFGCGILFKILPDGSNYVKLLDFTGTSNGSYPYGSLITDGTFLYGMTSYGGLNDDGTIFKIMPDGTGYVKLLDLSGPVHGSHPQGSLISDGTFLYGMAYNFGIYGQGTLFIIMPDGSSFSTLIAFDGGSYSGSPLGSPIQNGGFLFGTTQGSAGDSGTVFKYQYTSPTDIYGHVTDTNGNVTNGVAIIYPYDSVYAAFDTLQIQPLDASGNYHFANVFAGDYLIKIYNDTIAYPNITSTYYGNQWVWDSAAVLHHSALVDDTANVIMIELNLGGGFGLFHGQIIEGFGFGRSPGDPVSNVNVKLGITGTSQLVASTLTDANGKYTFANMPLGNYTVYVDIPGLIRDSSYTFTADSANSQYLCLDYVVDSVAIYALPCSTAGINTIITEQTKFNIYPNPVRENTTIRYSISSTANVQLDIYNVFGVKVQSLVNTQQESGEYNFNFNPKSMNLKPGVYFVSLSANGKTSTRRIVVME